MPKTSSLQDNEKVDGLTVKEAAYFLGVDPKTVYGWIYNKKIKFFRIGGKNGSIRIKKEHLGQIIHTNFSTISNS